MHLVSVVLPVFNAEKTIARAVHSILQQSWTNLELIVVNDGSSDQTIRQLAQIRDPRLKIFTTENQGVASAANFGLKQCQGEWVARMDADDFSHPQRIDRQYHHLKEERLDVVGSQVRILNGAGQPVDSMQRYEDWINRETIDANSIVAKRFVELPLVNPTVLANRKYFELGYMINEFPEDYDLFLRGVEFGFRFGKVPEVLLDWYELATGLTRTNSRYSNEAFDLCRKEYLLRGPLNGHKKVDLWGAGKTGKPWLKWLLSNGINVNRLIDVGPKKIGQTIHGCIVESPESIKQPTNTPMLIAVGRAGARDLIQNFLEDQNFVTGSDAWFVA